MTPSLGAMTPIYPNHPAMKAFEAYRQTESYKNSRKWTASNDHVDGSLWAVFLTGWDSHKHENEEAIKTDQWNVVMLVRERDAAFAESTRKTLQLSTMRYERDEFAKVVENLAQQNTELLEDIREMRREREQLKIRIDALKMKNASIVRLLLDANAEKEPYKPPVGPNRVAV